MAKEFRIPEYATFAQISQCLAQCSNSMASVSEKVGCYKADVALKATTLKRALARATIVHKGEKNATIVKAMADLDPKVIQAQDEYDSASAIYIIAQGELDAWECQFVALRKMVSIREIEVKGNIG